MSSTDSLLWLKYVGLPCYEEIYSKRDFYAFKCKKYAYWKDVHSSANAKDLLLSCFESLKSNEDLSLEQFERISTIESNDLEMLCPSLELSLGSLKK